MSRIVHKKPQVFLTLKLVHMALSTMLFYGAWLMFRYGQILGIEKMRGFRYNYLIVGLYIVLMLIFTRTYNAYLVGYSSIRALVIAQFISQLFTCGLIYVMTAIAWLHVNHPGWLIALLFIQFFVNCLWCYEVTRYFYKVNPPKRTILVYRDNLDKRRFGSIV